MPHQFNVRENFAASMVCLRQGKKDISVFIRIDKGCRSDRITKGFALNLIVDFNMFFFDNWTVPSSLLESGSLVGQAEVG